MLSSLLTVLQTCVLTGYNGTSVLLTLRDLGYNYLPHQVVPCLSLSPLTFDLESFLWLLISL